MNNVSLVGRLTRDVDLRYTTKKVKAVGSFILAVDRDVRNMAGERTTDFIPIVTWGKTAEFASKYFVKGQRVALQGSIHTRMWEDDQKNKHYATEVVADKVFFADAKQKESDEDTIKDEMVPANTDHYSEEDSEEILDMNLAEEETENVV